ncbi:MAG: NADH-quinone oxidoreductase subunit A [Dehalococcoidia bacterium]|nr:NADH-quinone oxidoreductase subunit A [Dehalococcoidia bacterium]
MGEFGFVGFLLLASIVVAVLLPLVPLILSWFGIVPYNPGREKESTYESGMRPTGQAWSQFNFRYYFFALLFVVFDILSIFLFPWAVNVGRLGLAGLISILAFFVAIAVAYIYAWHKKALEWK